MKKFFKILLFIILGAGIIWTFTYLWKKSKPKVEQYEITNAKIGDITKKTLVTGSIGPRDEVQIKPQVSGIISEIKKEAGQPVEKGDVIAVVKVIPEISSLTAAESQVRLSKMNLDNVEKTYNRQNELKQKGVISNEEFETAELQYAQAKENFEAAQDQLNIVKEGISKKVSEYSNTKIRATISGTILDVPVKVGNSVIMANTFNDGTTIATIADMKDMVFTGKVDESEVGKIKEGMDIILTIGAMNDKKFNATLEYISPKGLESSGAVFFEMRAAAQIPDDVFLRAGYSANAELILDEAPNALTLPESCIEYSGDSAFVYVCTSEKPNQVFERRAVKTGLSNGVDIVIESGIAENEKVRGNIIYESK